MQIHELKRRTVNSRSQQVGRGGKRGKTAGRGTKGQKARAGRKLRPEHRDQIKKLPKLRGYRFNAYRPKPRVLNLSDLDQAFESGALVTTSALVDKKLLPKNVARRPLVKILGTGQISKPLQLSGLVYSATVKQKIEAAGGTVEQ